MNTDVSKDFNALVPEGTNDQHHNCEDINYELSPTATDFKLDRKNKY